MSDIAIQKKTLAKKAYQAVELPNGSAPVAVSEVPAVFHGGTGNSAEFLAGGIALYYLAPVEVPSQYVTKFGVYLVKTGQPLPDDVHLFPVPRPLLNRVDPPDARYVGSAGDWHVFLGNPRD